MKITEVFYSLQGEGARAGEPSIFVRLAGCNLACGFCDTEFESGREMTCQQLYEYMRAIVLKTTGVVEDGQSKWMVWTGGEPMLQLTREVVDFFREKHFLQAIETNGAYPIPFKLDWIVVSPKVAEHVLAKNFPEGCVDELRYVRHCGQPGVPKPALDASRKYLSPMFNGNRPDMENVRHCAALCLANPEWRLSLQLHKLIGIL